MKSKIQAIINEWEKEVLRTSGPQIGTLTVSICSGLIKTQWSSSWGFPISWRVVEMKRDIERLKEFPDFNPDA
jgi:hypothetical protein